MSTRTAYFYDPDVGNFHYGKMYLCLLADVANVNQWTHSLQMLTVYFYKCRLIDLILNWYARKSRYIFIAHVCTIQSRNQKSEEKKKLLLCISFI